MLKVTTAHIKVNGISTVSENIADNAAWREAYLKWCEKVEPEYLKSVIEKGIYPPQKFRVIGPVSNLEQFAEDFQCKPGSRMNPEEKCEVW
ncbi:Neprilysin, partial [Stegodyphus mimosarum]